MIDRRLRVALAIGSLEIGGAETQLVDTACALKARGQHVEVFVLGVGRGILAQRLADSGVALHSLGIRARVGGGQPWRRLLHPANFFAAVRFCRLVRRGRFDVMHAYLFVCYAALIPLAWVCGVSIRICARRGLHESLPAHPLVMPLTRLSTLLSAVVVANSQAVADDARRAEHVPAEKLRVIPNGVALPRTAADPGNEPAVGICIANLIGYKGHLDLAQALASLSHPPVVRCIGEGPMRSAIEGAITAAGLQQVMLLEGARSGASACYLEGQFAVLASHAEGMPNALLEAMAAGLPVVATAVGGAVELVTDGVNGLLVPPHRPDLLAAAIQRMASDRAFRIAAGAAGRKWAEAFSQDACADAYLALYRKLAQHPGAL